MFGLNVLGVSVTEWCVLSSPAVQDHEDTVQVGSWEKRIEKKKAGKCTTVTVDPSKAADSTLISHRQGPREEERL